MADASGPQPPPTGPVHDPQIQITLNYSTWCVIAEHVARGTFAEVMHIMVALHLQSEAQLRAYEAQVAAEAERVRADQQTNEPALIVAEPSPGEMKTVV